MVVSKFHGRKLLKNVIAYGLQQLLLTVMVLATNSTAGEIAQISEYIQEFGDPDPWMDKIAQYIVISEEVTAAEVLTNALELDPRSQGRT